MPHVRIIRKPRLRTLRLAVLDERTVTVTVPLSYSDRQVHDLLERKKRWITKHLSRHRALAEERASNVGTALLLGRRYAIAFTEEAEEDVHFDEASGIVYIRGDKRSSLHVTLERWYRARAATLIPPRVKDLAVEHRLSVGSITIRGQRTRWGSCSSSGNLSFNWKLLQAPPFILEYVICHEVAHVRFMSHSQEFWRFTEQLCPRYREAKAWLREHGMRLG